MLRKGLLFLITLSSFSCQKHLCLKYDNLAEVEEQMFGISDSLSIIEIDFNENKKQLTTIVSNSFDYDICEKWTYFGLKINKSVFPVKVFKECEDPYRHGIPMIKLPEVQIKLNSRGQILYNIRLISNISSISKEIKNDFGSSIDNGRHEICVE
ncbi:MAG: hypothetical protein AB8B74_08085 [Crocinitomicaceae bacterium]